MSIVEATFGLLGQDGVTPRRVQMVVTDSFSAITGANYLTQVGVSPDSVYPTDIFDITYAYNSVTNTGTYGQFLVSVGVNGSLTLVPANCTTNVGVFTPVLNFGGASTGILYSVQSGTYSLIGNSVVFNLNIQLSSKGSSTGAATITGLPKPARSTFVAPLYTSNVTFTGVPELFLGAGNSSVSLVQVQSGGSTAALGDGAFTNSSWVLASGSYLV